MVFLGWLIIFCVVWMGESDVYVFSMSVVVLIYLFGCICMVIFWCVWFVLMVNILGVGNILLVCWFGSFYRLFFIIFIICNVMVLVCLGGCLCNGLLMMSRVSLCIVDYVRYLVFGWCLVGSMLVVVILFSVRFSNWNGFRLLLLVLVGFVLFFILLGIVKVV